MSGMFILFFFSSDCFLALCDQDAISVGLLLYSFKPPFGFVKSLANQITDTSILDALRQATTTEIVTTLRVACAVPSAGFSTRMRAMRGAAVAP